MNKITSTLTGLALAATASVVPAFAQGNLFSPPGSFTFTTTAAGVLTATGTGETFNQTAVGSAPITPVSFTLIGSSLGGSMTFYSLTSLTINGTGVGSGATPNSFVETGALTFSALAPPSGGVAISSIGAAADGTTFNLVSAPVPEASTVVSFGALLALSGLVLVTARRKKMNTSAL